MSEMDELVRRFEEAGGDKHIFEDDETAHLAASGDKILSMRGIKGIEVTAQSIESGISARVRVIKGMHIQNPVHLCFGIFHMTGTQKIIMEVKFEKDSAANFIAHCIFPKARNVKHIMEAVTDIGENACMNYSEVHYHGIYGGIEVYPEAKINIAKNGRYFADFTLIKGRVGKLRIDYLVNADENAVTELNARVFGHEDDDISINERVILNGINARGLIKTRIAIENNAKAEVTGITEGNASGARGHVDCMEIVKDNAVAKAVPIVTVSNALAKVTHEAAIGSVDKKQMETLMSHGLSPEEAVDVIVKGILK